MLEVADRTQKVSFLRVRLYIAPPPSAPLLPKLISRCDSGAHTHPSYTVQVKHPLAFMPGSTKLRAFGSASLKASTGERLSNVLGPCHETDAKNLYVFIQTPTK